MDVGGGHGRLYVEADARPQWRCGDEGCWGRGEREGRREGGRGGFWSDIRRKYEGRG